MAVRIENFANTRARSNHKAVKCVNAEGRKCKYIAKFTCLPVRELASVPGWPPPQYTLSSYPHSVCLCSATADRQVQLAEQVEAAAMRSSDRTQDRHDTGHWPKGHILPGCNFSTMWLFCKCKWSQNNQFNVNVGARKFEEAFFS